MVEFLVPPHIPTPQGHKSPTFKPPPLDGSYTLPELYGYHAENSPDHPVFVFPDGKGQTRTVCYPEAWRMICRTAMIVQGYYKRSEDKYAAQEGLRPVAQAPTIGVLASAGLYSFLSTLILF